MGGIVGALIGQHYARKWWEEKTLAEQSLRGVNDFLFNPATTQTPEQADMWWDMHMKSMKHAPKELIDRAQQGYQQMKAAKLAQMNQPKQAPPQVAPEAQVPTGPLPSPGLPPPPAAPSEPPQLFPAFRSPVGGGSDGGPVPLQTGPLQPPPPPPNTVPMPPEVAGPSEQAGQGFTGLPAPSAQPMPEQVAAPAQQAGQGFDVTKIGGVDLTRVPGAGVGQITPYQTGLRQAAATLPGQQQALAMTQAQLEMQKNMMGWLTTPKSQGGAGLTSEQAANYLNKHEIQWAPSHLVKPGEVLTVGAGPEAGKILGVGAPRITQQTPGSQTLVTPTVPGGEAISGMPGGQVIQGPPQLLDPTDRAAKAAWIAQKQKVNPAYVWSDADLPTARKSYNDSIRVVGGDTEQFKAALKAQHPDWSDARVGATAGRMVIDKFNATVLAGQGGSLTDEDLKNIARLALVTGQQPNLGMGKSQLKERYFKQAAGLIGEQGVGSVAEARAELKASGQALGALEKNRSTVGAFENTFQADLKNAQDAAAKVPRTATRLYNNWSQLASANLSDQPELAAFRVATQTAINQYARLMFSATGGGQSTNDARAHAEALLNAAMPTGAYKAAIDQMNLEARNRLTGLDQEIKARREELKHGPLQAPPPQKMIKAFDEKGVLHEAPEGTPLPRGWKLK